MQTSVFLPFFFSWTVLGGVLFEIFSLKGPAAAIGLFKSVISTLLVGISYWTAYRFSHYRIF